jgi:hypothetical protein
MNEKSTTLGNPSSWLFHSAGVLLSFFALGGCANHSAHPLTPKTFIVATPLPDSIGELRKVFRTRYDEAIAAHSQQLRSSVPIVTQDLLNMTLLRASGPPAHFSLKSGPYFLMAHTSHPPLTVYSILAVQGFGKLSDPTRQELAEYQQTLEKAMAGIRSLELPPDTERRLTTILSQTESFVAQSLTSGVVTREQFEAYAEPLRAPIRENLRVGANEQLLQFRAEITAWEQEFPQEDWANLRVVVLGVHQARNEYALKLFFQWLLHEPDFEHRVVYAEFQAPPVGDARAAAEAQALQLLTKVDFEQEAGRLIFGDPTILQKDVMGPAALEILGNWGDPHWP